MNLLKIWQLTISDSDWWTPLHRNKNEVLLRMAFYIFNIKRLQPERQLRLHQMSNRYFLFLLHLLFNFLWTMSAQWPYIHQQEAVPHVFCVHTLLKIYLQPARLKQKYFDLRNLKKYLQCLFSHFIPPSLCTVMHHLWTFGLF